MIRFVSTTEPFELDGVEYRAEKVKARDICEGGFYYELTKKFSRENALLQARLAGERKRYEEAAARGEAYVPPEGEELIEGSSSRLVTDFQSGILKHYTDIPRDIIDGLPLETLGQLSAYVETGRLPDEDRAGDAAEDGGSKNGPGPGGEKPPERAAPVITEARGPDQAQI